jgi:hypothetical protein
MKRAMSETRIILPQRSAAATQERQRGECRSGQSVEGSGATLILKITTSFPPVRVLVSGLPVQFPV